MCDAHAYFQYRLSLYRVNKATFRYEAWPGSARLKIPGSLYVQYVGSISDVRR